MECEVPIGAEQLPAAVETTKHPARLRHLAGTALRAAGCIVAGIAPGAIGGAVTGAGLATHESAHVTVLPGIEAEAQLVSGTTSELSFGPLSDYGCFNQLPQDILATYISPNLTHKPAGNFDLSSIHATLINHLNVGVHVTLTRIDCNDKTLQALADAFHSDKAATAIIESPIEHALEQAALTDIETLAFAGGVTTLTLAAVLLRLKKCYAELDGSERQAFLARHGTATLALALSGLLVGGASTGAGLFTSSALSVPSSNRHIGPEIVTQVPFLANASVSSDSLLAELDGDIGQILQEKDQIDSYYTMVQQNIHEALTQWLHNSVNQAIVANNNLIPALMMSGRHCSDPTGEVIAPEIMKLLKPLLVFDTGNVDVAPNLPLHDFCVSLVQKGLEAAVHATGQKVYMYAAAGKHDDMQATMGAETTLQITGPDGKPYQPIITFGMTDTHSISNYGVSVIGGSSAVESPDGQYDNVRLPTAPATEQRAATPHQQNMAYYQAGQSALKACRADNSEGIAPIAIFNSREQGYPLLNDCMPSALLSGEGPAGFFTYSQSSNTTNIVIESSSAGNGATCDDFRPYQKIVGGAQYIFFLINPATNKLAYYANLQITDAGSVSISSLQPLPTNAYSQTLVSSFDNTHGAAIHSSTDTQKQNPENC